MDEHAAFWLSAAQTIGEHAIVALAMALPAVLGSTALAFALVRRLTLPSQPSRLPPSLFLVLRLAAGLALVLGAAALFAEMIEALDGEDTMGRFDNRLAEVLSRSLSPGVLRFFGAATHLGDPLTLAVIVVAVAAALFLYGRRWLALGWVLACAGNGVLNHGLKQIFVRVRPVHEHGFAVADGFSFPSGHTSGSVVVYGMLAYLGVRLLPPRWHLPAVLAAATLAFGMGTSRVLLQVHWASDVLAGFGSGLVWLSVCVLSIEMLRHYRKR